MWKRTGDLFDRARFGAGAPKVSVSRFDVCHLAKLTCACCSTCNEKGCGRGDKKSRSEHDANPIGKISDQDDLVLASVNIRDISGDEPSD